MVAMKARVEDLHLQAFNKMLANNAGPTGCALAAPPPIDGNDIVAETEAEKRTISLDAKRRPLQARVGRER